MEAPLGTEITAPEAVELLEADKLLEDEELDEDVVPRFSETFR